ncbi:MAG: hypothetical protein LCH39_12660 [Proteobacteria bacterium]|nr:hypothetical protein [Pseudomonadota bacterium]
MSIKSLIKGAALGAGAVILFAGLALAQTPPAPAAPSTAPAPQATTPAKPESAMDRREMHRKMRDECRDKMRDMKGEERRDGMRKCMSEARADRGHEGRGQHRAKMKEVREACRAELKDQRFTEDERRKAMQDCAVKKDPSLAKMFACRDEAEAKKLERGSREMRSFMRECNTRR